MPDIIKILPDSVANQIAAGEVIQRPASVVKELMENSVDAESKNIKIYIKDAGKSLIQVIDDGKGMSETDARIAFERHSTSKINSADDLFSLYTKGFRGEALASIASVAQVELITKNENSDLGTKIIIEGSQFISQEEVNCPKGSNLIIKNLFYNVPARRKFLKGTNTEFNHIVTEFQRLSIAHPDISFVLYHNDKEIFNLPVSNLKQRLINIFGKNINQNLTAISSKTAIVNIYGYIGKPEIAKKQYGQQFLFVNNRFFKNTYFHKAITLGYDNILAPETVPIYFIFFDVEPDLIDINIHPTKTEINFQDANAIFQLIKTAIKETLSKHNIMPAIDFDTIGKIDIPFTKKNQKITAPQIEINENYNPFEKNELEKLKFHHHISEQNFHNQNINSWEKLYEHNMSNYQSQNTLNIENNTNFFDSKKFLQLKDRYIVTSIKSGMMIIDYKRAMERINFDKYYKKIEETKIESQQNLFEEKIDFNSEDLIAFEEIFETLNNFGFNFEKFSSNTYAITGIPSFLKNIETVPLIYDFIAYHREYNQDIRPIIIEKIAYTLTKQNQVLCTKISTTEEMSLIFDQLFSTSNPNYTYDGKIIISIVSYEEIEKRF